jgi:hypothetical protein
MNLHRFYGLVRRQEKRFAVKMHQVIIANILCYLCCYRLERSHFTFF